MAINPGNKFAADVVTSDIQVFSVDVRTLPPNTNVNIDGFELHREIHKIRRRPSVALHTHSPYVAAVSSMESGLLPISQAALEFVHNVKYLRYDGLLRGRVFSEDLRAFAQDGGIAILRNHGDLIIGESVEEAVYLAYFLEEACRIQCHAMISGRTLHEPTQETVRSAGKSLVADRPLIATTFFEALCKRLGVEP